MCFKAAWRASCSAKLVIEETRQATLRVRRPQERVTHKSYTHATSSCYVCTARLPRVQARLIRRRPRWAAPGRAVALLGRLAPPRAVQLVLLGPGAPKQSP